MAGLLGLVLAAGGGARFGGPKALARTASGEPWLERSIELLHGAGCSPVLAVLGAGAEEASGLVPPGARAVVAPAWRAGLGASLATGIEALPDGDAVLISLVDLPDLPVAVVERVLAVGAGPDALARAVYAGVPGHPVLLGRDHWGAFRHSLAGDRGGADYLGQHGVRRVECGDLFSGRDVDRR